MITRRNFCAGLATGLAGLIAAPYVVRNSGVLMPVRDRSLATYFITGHDAWGNRVSELITLPTRVALKIDRAKYQSPTYGELVEPLFQEAFRRGRLADYNRFAYGASNESAEIIVRGDDFRGLQIIHPSVIHERM